MRFWENFKDFGDGKSNEAIVGVISEVSCLRDGLHQGLLPSERQSLGFLIEANREAKICASSEAHSLKTQGVQPTKPCPPESGRGAGRPCTRRILEMA